MHLYMSGTPRNDGYMVVENKLCTHRLFSMHGSYEDAVMRWLDDVKQGLTHSAKTFFDAHPSRARLLVQQDARRRRQQAQCDDTSDWDTCDVIDTMTERLNSRGDYPKFIMLDSGAFTAWNKGEETTLDEVVEKYSRFIGEAGELFEEIWLVNLDVIPGERGRDPTAAEISAAIKQSDENLHTLQGLFGSRVLPVFHQGEPRERLFEVADQVPLDGYICLSPRNDMAESHRVRWSSEYHGYLRHERPSVKTHGLATTGNEMIRTVPWYSGDSAAWVHHAGFGMIDVFFDKQILGRRSARHYSNYFLSLEQLWSDSDNYGDIVGGSASVKDKFFERCSEGIQRHIRERVAVYNVPFDVIRWDFRMRCMICMGELATFAESVAGDALSARSAASLFGGLDALE